MSALGKKYSDLTVQRLVVMMMIVTAYIFEAASTRRELTHISQWSLTQLSLNLKYI